MKYFFTLEVRKAMKEKKKRRKKEKKIEQTKYSKDQERLNNISVELRHTVHRKLC